MTVEALYKMTAPKSVNKDAQLAVIAHYKAKANQYRTLKAPNLKLSSI